MNVAMIYPKLLTLFLQKKKMWFNDTKRKNRYLKLPTKLALLMVVYNSSGPAALKLQISTVIFII